MQIIQLIGLEYCKESGKKKIPGGQDVVTWSFQGKLESSSKLTVVMSLSGANPSKETETEVTHPQSSGKVRSRGGLGSSLGGSRKRREPTLKSPASARDKD